MITFIAFLLTISGCINWLLIGLLQYDFIAGIFGFQASIMSRIVYILFGIGAAYLIVRIIVNKGSVKIFEKKKQKFQQSPAKANNETLQEATPPQKPKKKWWQFWKKKQPKQTENLEQEKIEKTNILSEENLPSQARQQNFFDNSAQENKNTLFDEKFKSGE